MKSVCRKDLYCCLIQHYSQQPTHEITVKCPSAGEQIMKMYYIYIHNGILFRHSVILSCAATWTDIAIIILSEISQPEKDKYHMISFMWNLKRLGS